MRERRQVAGCSEGALPVDHRQDVVVEHVHEPLYRICLYSGIPVGKRLYLQQEHDFHDFRPYLLPCAAGVRHDQVVLELREVFLRDSDVAERAEPRRHTVDRTSDVIHLGVQVFAASFYRRGGLPAELQTDAAADDFRYSADCQFPGRDIMCVHLFLYFVSIFYFTFSSHFMKSSARERLTVISKSGRGLAVTVSRPRCFTRLSMACMFRMQLLEMRKNFSGSSSSDRMSKVESMMYFLPSKVARTVFFPSE